MYVYIYHKSVNFQQPVDWWTLLTVQYDNPIDLFTMGKFVCNNPRWHSFTIHGQFSASSLWLLSSESALATRSQAIHQTW